MRTFVKRLQANAPTLLALPSIILVLLIAIYPILYAFYTSLTDTLLNGSRSHFIWFDNYINMFTSKVFWHGLMVSVQYVGLAVGVEMLLGFGLALLLNRALWGRSFFRILILLPLMLPPATGALMWAALLDPSLGWINYALRQIGIHAPAWLSDSGTALYSVVGIDVYHFTPFVALILLAGLQSIPRLQYEVAEVDGASAWKTFRMVTLPQLMPTIFLVLLFRLVLCINGYDVINVATKGGPGDVTTTLSFQASVTGYRNMLLGQAGAYCVFMFFVILIISKQLFNRVSRSWT
jgi:multiple sugar transport system permease protein